MIAASALVLAFGVPAHAADDTGNETGGDVTSSAPDSSAAEQKQADMKAAVAEAFAKMASSDAASQAQANADYTAALNAYDAAYPGSSLVKSDPSVAKVRGRRLRAQQVEPPSSYPGTYDLNVAQEAQKTHYYCGPASGKMILTELNAGASDYTDHLPLSQASLAKDSYMQTDRYQETAWASHRFKLSLNRWLTGSPNGLGWYVDVDTPSVDDFKAYVEYDIYHGHPFGVDTVEIASSEKRALETHYNNHPCSETLGHWIVAEGYYNDIHNVYFNDPASNLWDGTDPKFGYSLSAFDQRFLQNNGIVS